MIHTLRSQPKAVRQGITYVTTGTVMAVLLGVWASSLPTRFDSAVASNTPGESASPFSIIGAQTASVGTAIKDAIASFKEGTPEEPGTIERVSPSPRE